LHRHRVEHVVFGAVALGFNGHVRATVDLDLIVRPDEQNLRRVHDWLVALDAHLLLRPARRFGSRERREMLKGSSAAVLTRLGRVDIVQRLPGPPEWERLVAESERYELGDISVAVLAGSTLMELKRRRGSGQDMADIEAIELLDRLED
jgi:hypothetical protein